MIVASLRANASNMLVQHLWLAFGDLKMDLFSENNL